MKTKSRNRTRATDRGNEHVDQTLMDAKLFKAIGLYHVLYPNSHWYRPIMIGNLWLIFGLQIVRMYFAFAYVDLAPNLIAVIIANLMGMYKEYVILNNTDVMRDVLNVARFAFASSCGVRQADAFYRSRRTIRTSLRCYAAIGLSLIIIWTSSPNTLKNMFEYIDLPDGLWTMLWAIDGISITMYMKSVLSFDCYLITVCIALNRQFKTVTAGYEALGHSSRSPSPSSSPMDVKFKSVKRFISINDLNPDETKLIYEKLINLIRDSQQIVQKCEDFFSVVRSVVIIQIITGSITLLGCLFNCISMYNNGWPILSIPVMLFFYNFIAATFQIFIPCMSINNVVKSKSEMNFGLYSSNWTEMDMKFKKTLLLAMRMNTTHQQKIKLTPMNVVNLEMFSNVMNINYSILTVLLKMKSNQ